MDLLLPRLASLLGVTLSKATNPKIRLNVLNFLSDESRKINPLKNCVPTQNCLVAFHTFIKVMYSDDR